MIQRNALRLLWATTLIATVAVAATKPVAPMKPNATTKPLTPTVLITGSSRGIGFEFAQQYAAAGWQVIATARKPGDSKALTELAAAHNNVRLEPLDVTDAASIATLAQRLAGAPIDVLINNAGDTDEFRGQSFGRLNHDRFSALMELNAHGPLRVSEALIGNVLASQQKKIIAVSSLAGSFATKGGGMPGGYWYKSSKAALNMIMLGLSQDLKPKGVIVNCLSPGQVDTHGYAARGIRMPNTVDIRESVAGMVKVIAGLTIEQTGQFIRYNGELQGW